MLLGNMALRSSAMIVPHEMQLESASALSFWVRAGFGGGIEAGLPPIEELPAVEALAGGDVVEPLLDLRPDQGAGFLEDIRRDLGSVAGREVVGEPFLQEAATFGLFEQPKAVPEDFAHGVVPAGRDQIQDEPVQLRGNGHVYALSD